MNYSNTLTSVIKKTWIYIALLIAVVAFITIYNSIGYSNYEPNSIGRVHLMHEYKFQEDLGVIQGVSNTTFHSNKSRVSVKDSLYGKLYFRVRGTKKSKFVEIEFDRNSTEESWQISNVEVLD